MLALPAVTVERARVPSLRHETSFFLFCIAPVLECSHGKFCVNGADEVTNELLDLVGRMPLEAVRRCISVHCLSFWFCGGDEIFVAIPSRARRRLGILRRHHNDSDVTLRQLIQGLFQVKDTVGFRQPRDVIRQREG